MRTIIAGSRRGGFVVRDVAVAMDRALTVAGIAPTEVLSGTAPGPDRLGEMWAHGREIPISRYPADWERYGRSAGIRRNCVMVANADALVALWDGESRGTAHVIQEADVHGLIVYVYTGEDGE